MLSENNNDDRQHPRVDSLQALLRFAIHHTKSEDAPHESSFEKMDPEKRKFLEEALKSWTVDIMEELEKAVKILESTESSVDEKLQSLELIEELAVDIDLANNFLKIGGSKIILTCLDSQDFRIRASSIELIGELTQNNPFAQSHFTEIDTIPKLLLHLKDENSSVLKSTLHALSCLIRKYEPALAIYIEKNGLKLLLDCLERSKHEEKLLAKLSFLIDALSSEYPEVRQQLIKLGAIEMLANILIESINTYSGNYDAKIEHLLSALKTMSESSATRDKLKEIDNFESSIKQIIDLCQSKEECEEIINYSQQIIMFLRSETDDIAQRPPSSNLQISVWHDRTNQCNTTSD